MLSGCAVVTTGSGGAMEVAKLADLPLFPKGDAPALAQILESLIHNRHVLERIARRGQEVALREFSSDLMVQQLCTTFQNLCEQKKATKIRDNPIVRDDHDLKSVAHGGI
jgi:glycosyltransferase involved in cell wall biosynthesis